MHASALLLLLLVQPARAKDETAAAAPLKPAPALQAAPLTKPAEAKPEPVMAEPAKEEPAKAEPAKTEPAKAEPAKAEAAKPEPAPAPAPEPKAAKKAEPLSPEALISAELKVLEDTAKVGDAEAQEEALRDVQAFAAAHVDSPAAASALNLEAFLYRKRGDQKQSIVTLLRLVHEYPESAAKVKGDILESADKKLPKKYKTSVEDAAKGSSEKEKPARLAALLARLSDELAEALYEPSVAEFHDFEARYPSYERMDAVLFNLARLHERNGRYQASLHSLRKLLALYPASPLDARARLEVARIHADDLREYQKAVYAYEGFLMAHPEPGADHLVALQRCAQLLADKLKENRTAVEKAEKIIALYPKTEAALGAYRLEAKLQRERLASPGDAIKTYRRLAEQFSAPAAVAALQDAATVARKDLKDYGQEIELRKKIAADYAGTKEASAELFAAAEVYEDDVKDADMAVKTYKEVATKFPASKEAKKASDRAAKLEKKKQSAP